MLNLLSSNPGGLIRRELVEDETMMGNVFATKEGIVTGERMSPARSGATGRHRDTAGDKIRVPNRIAARLIEL